MLHVMAIPVRDFLNSMSIRLDLERGTTVRSPTHVRHESTYTNAIRPNQGRCR